ncbi:hypothetical protein AcW1_010266 [Taiwanofungus camphoratus]|nr:hypothetical protein AcV5_010552 [Antrodia cinnamomea]KAI0944764.1 hypothetical protein AcW1_010266 [Antrodia cinnamomea]
MLGAPYLVPPPGQADGISSLPLFLHIFIIRGFAKCKTVFSIYQESKITVISKDKFQATLKRHDNPRHQLLPAAMSADDVLSSRLSEYRHRMLPAMCTAATVILVTHGYVTGKLRRQNMPAGSPQESTLARGNDW